MNTCVFISTLSVANLSTFPSHFPWLQQLNVPPNHVHLQLVNHCTQQYSRIVTGVSIYSGFRSSYWSLTDQKQHVNHYEEAPAVSHTAFCDIFPKFFLKTPLFPKHSAQLGFDTVKPTWVKKRREEKEKSLKLPTDSVLSWKPLGNILTPRSPPCSKWRQERKKLFITHFRLI